MASITIWGSGSVRIIIVGAGAVGAPIADRLSKRGQKVTVVEKDPKIAKNIAKKIDAEIFVGDGASKKILNEAGTKESDIFLALTDDDKANIRATALAKREFGVPFVLALSNSPKQIDTLIQSGADQIVCPEEEVLALIENIVVKGGVSSIFHDRMTNCKMYRVDIQSNSPIIGKKINEIKMPGLAKICAFTRRKRFQPVESDVQLQLGDQIYVVGPAADVEKSEDIFA